MNGYNFSERVRKVLAMAREESIRLHHEYVGTEHLLLGLIREDHGVGVGIAVLQNLDIDLVGLRDTIEATVKQGLRSSTSPDIPYTSRAKKVLELAMQEARDLGHNYVGSEHLLMGLLREARGIAAQVLLESGLREQTARAELLRLLGSDLPRDASKPAVAGVSIEVARSDGTTARMEFSKIAHAVQWLWEQEKAP